MEIRITTSSADEERMLDSALSDGATFIVRIADKSIASTIESFMIYPSTPEGPAHFIIRTE